MKEGDLVIADAYGLGTWRQDMITEATNVMKVPSELDPVYAASLSVNPRTSYLLLKHFVKLKKGDVIIQNGGNSLVGMGVIQIAKQMGVSTINIVSAEMPDTDVALELLTNLGGDINILDSEMDKPLFRDTITSLPPILLGLNNIGGESAVNITRALGPNGTLVTYGGMSKKSPVIPLNIITDKPINLKGFWLTNWNEKSSKTQKIQMINELSQMVINKQLSLFFEVHDFNNLSHALTVPQQNPHSMKKLMMCMNYPHSLNGPKDTYDFARFV